MKPVQQESRPNASQRGVRSERLGLESTPDKQPALMVQVMQVLEVLAYLPLLDRVQICSIYQAAAANESQK
jgi:hypothetical protein